MSVARHLSGSAFFPDAPYLTGQYDNDQILGSNHDYKTTQAELGTPLWLPGEGTATERVANADAASVDAARRAAQLALAADVVDLATRARFALEARDVAARRLTTNTALARSTAQRFQVGEGSQSDSLAADAEASSASASLEEPQAALEAAVVTLAKVTGRNTVPTLDPPPLLHAASLARDPRIMAAEQGGGRGGGAGQAGAYPGSQRPGAWPAGDQRQAVRLSVGHAGRRGVPAELRLRGPQRAATSESRGSGHQGRGASAAGASRGDGRGAGGRHRDARGGPGEPCRHTGGVGSGAATRRASF